MTSIYKNLLLLFVSACLICGCNPAQEGEEGSVRTKSGEQGHSHAEGDGHSHEDGHAHGDDHVHGPGPHGGTIADWGGGKFHVEFTVDHDKQESVVYIYGSDEKTAAPIDAEKITLSILDPAFSVELMAKPLSSEILGGSSRFVGTHENLGIVKEYEGSMSGVVEGTPYSGEFKEE